jgi:thiamine biosynthesis lipoprotein
MHIPVTLKGFVAVLLALLSQIALADWQRQEADIMGTRITVELFHNDTEVARQGIRSVMAEMRRIDQTMSPYIESSDLARINRDAGIGAVTISEELYALIEQSIHFSALTRGAFDITFASAGYLYDYRNRRRPNEQQLHTAVGLIDYRELLLDSKKRAIRFRRPGMRIDLGGIAKGYAVDRCIAQLRALDIHSALVTAGGDSRVVGDRWGRPWTIGIRDPRARDGVVALIPLRNVAISTSGDYERYFVENGTRYHHIIDPTTGESANDLRSATIIGPNATTTDALSTSVFVLGLERGMALVNDYAGIDAILVDHNGKLHYSEGLMDARKADRQLGTSTSMSVARGVPCSAPQCVSASQTQHTAESRRSLGPS